MRCTLLFNILKLLKAKENKVLSLWEQALPFSLDELESRLTALTTETVKETSVTSFTESGTESFEELLAQLEHMWEMMEDLDDCSVV